MRGLLDIFNRWWDVLGKQRVSHFPYEYTVTHSPFLVVFGYGDTETRLMIHKWLLGVSYVNTYTAAAGTYATPMSVSADVGTVVRFDQLSGTIKFLSVDGTVVFDDR